VDYKKSVKRSSAAKIHAYRLPLEPRSGVINFTFVWPRPAYLFFGANCFYYFSLAVLRVGRLVLVGCVF